MTQQKVIISTNFEIDLNQSINDISEENIFILTDENTYQNCLPVLLKNPKLVNRPVCKIPFGDTHKNIETLASVWDFLCKKNATRKSTLINLGGGMVTDLGGFAASTFKRGISYINIPTTLLGAVDAAVGGKTGINFNSLKNEIGVINPSKSVIINTKFFSSLSYDNLLSGFAEILKHALISAPKDWEKLMQFDIENFPLDQLQEILSDSIKIKERIVEQDPFEINLRKSLNFGHTIGHAFESVSHEKKVPILHGYAVAWGIIGELYLSHKILKFPKEILLQATKFIKTNYGAFPISCKDYEHLFDLMTHDKKNDTKEINFTLLSGIGEIHTNQHTSKKLIFEALDFYCDSVGL